MSSFIARRLKNFDSSKIRAAFEFAQDIPSPIDLSIGFPEDDTPDYIKLAGVEAINNNHTRYTATNGMPQLRQAIARKLERENQISSSPARVTITPGITTGILLTYLVVLDPGDEILLPDPMFPPYKDLAVMLGAKPVFVDTIPNFQLAADLIEPLITTKTKALVINSPNNPSGAIYPKSELVRIATLAKKHRLLIISDEVYEHFAYDEPHFSIGSVYRDTVTLNGFSKSYAMTGWRIGYASGPQEIIDAINELQQYAVFSSSSIGQHAALAALRRSPKTIVGSYKAKRDGARSVLERTFPDIHGAQGAFYFFLKLPAGIDDMSFVNHISHRGVIVLPGSAFSRHTNYIRISFASEKENLLEGLKRVCESLEIMRKVSRR
ncbi:MAG: aminotransferase class I/II-fold pyridoxal phosphate-dependent enzyme [Candidatus Saccharimonadales bacterium]